MTRDDSYRVMVRSIEGHRLSRMMSAWTPVYVWSTWARDLDFLAAVDERNKLAASGVRTTTLPESMYPMFTLAHSIA